MRKFKLLLLVLPVLFFSACDDESGLYVEQLYTETEMITALKQCITACGDTANAHLSIPDSAGLGFYNYKNGLYRINLPSSASFIVDTLLNHGYEDLTNSFILQLNNAASNCGNGIKSFISNSLNTIDFIDPWTLLKKDSTSIVSHFETYYYVPFVNSTTSLINAQFSSSEVGSAWNELLTEYANYNSHPVTFDLNTYVAQSIVNSIIEEMKLEEILIRTDSTHRGNSSNKMYYVFGN